MKRAFLLALAAVTIATAAAAGTAAAAYTYAYWKPARMDAAIQAVNYPAGAFTKVTAVACTGQGRHTRAGWTHFVCAVTLTPTPGESGQSTVTQIWARPLADGRPCVTPDPRIPCNAVTHQHTG